MNRIRFGTLMLLSLSTLLFASSAAAQFTLTTNMTSNSSAAPGNMFDLTTNANTVTITQFDANTSLTVGAAQTYEIYYKAGTFVGFEANSAAWTLHDTVTTVSAGQDNPTPLALNTPLVLAPGSTFGIYITITPNNFNNRYLSAGGTWSDANLTLTAGTSNAYPFGQVFSPRGFSGQIHYSVAGGNGTLLTSQASNGIVASSSTDLVVQDMTLNAYGSNYGLNSVTFSQVGSMSDSDITNVKLYRDNNTDGAVDAGDTQLASGTLTSGAVTFSGGPLQALTAGTPVRLLLAIDTGASLTPGENLQFQITSSSDLTWSGGTDFTSFPSAGGTYSVIDPNIPYHIYYKMNEGTGTTTANDAIPGSGNNPASIGVTTAPNWVTPGRLGAAALDFSTGNGSGIASGWNANVTATESWTIETWLRQTATSAGYAFRFIGSSFRLYWTGSQLQLLSTGGTPTTTIVIPTPSVGTWFHVAIAYDAVAQEMTVYVDGNVLTVSARTAAFSGELVVGSYTSSSTRWYGEMDEFRVWNTVRSQGEIVAGMLSELPIQNSTILSATATKSGVSTPTTDAVVLDLNGYTFVNNNELLSLTVTRGGTALDSDFSNVTLYRDNNNDGVVDAGDTQLGTGTLTGGQVTFSGTPLQALNTATATRMLLAADIASALTPATTFSFSVTAATFSGGTDQTVYPVAGTTATVRDPQLPFHIYYKMNEGTGNQTVNDAVPGSGFATVNLSSTSTPTWVTPGQIGAAALNFDTASGSALDTGWTGGLPTTDDWTVETWLRRHNTTTTNYAFRFQGGLFSLLYSTTNGLHILASGLSTTSNILITTAAVDVWQHVAIVYTAATQELTIYVDGNLDSVTNTTANTSGLLVVGGISLTSTRWFGDLDEFRVWDVARSQAQIQAGQYVELPLQDSRILTSNSVAGGTMSATATDFVVADLAVATFIGTNSLLDATFTKNSSVSDANIGTLTLYLDSNDNGVVDIGTDAVLGSGTLTAGEISFTGSPLAGPTVGNPSRLLLAMNSTAGVQPGESVEFSVVSAADVTWAGSGTDITSYPVQGGSWVVIDPGMPFALYYKFNEGTGTTTANDAVPGQGNLNPAFGGTWQTPGQLGAAAVTFTAGADAVSTGWAFSLPNSQSWTIEYWIFKSGTASRYPFGSGSTATSLRGYWTGSNVHIYSAGGSNISSTGGLFTTGQWHHAAFVYDAVAQETYVYHNGTLNNTITGPQAPAATDFTIGARATTDTLFLDGSLDEFRFWTVARSQAEIVGGLNSELPLQPSYGMQLVSTAQSGTTVPQTDFVALDFGAGAILDPHNLNSITFNKTGSMADTHITSVKLYVDMNNNGVVDVGTDTLLGTTTLTGGQATFTGSPLLALAAGSVARLLLAVDIAAAAPPISTFEFSITSTGSSSWSGGGADITTYPLNGGSVFIIPPPLTGTYTINQTSGDFTDIGQAFDVLEVAGVSGAVILEITDSATYNSTPSYSLGITSDFSANAPVAGASATNTITLRAAANQTPEVIGSTSGAGLRGYSARGGIGIMQSFVSVEGLTVTGGPNFGIFIQGNGLSSIALSPVNNEIRRCTVYDIPDGPGIAFMGQNGAYFTNGVIENNFVWNCHTNSIPSTTVIQGSTSTAGCIAVRNPDISTGVIRHNTVVNTSTIANTAGIAISAASTAYAMNDVNNNIVVSAGASTHAYRANAVANAPGTANFNYWFAAQQCNQTTLATFAQWQTAGYDANGSDADPMLLDTSAATADLRLDPFSLCIDPVGQTSTLTVDIFGNTRPIGTTVDIGAHERASAPRPEMEVSRTAYIASGGTDALGNVSVFGQSVTWTIDNIGPGDLTITTPISFVPGTGNPSLTVTAQPANTVPGTTGSTTFTFDITPAVGAFAFQIEIFNNDINNNPYVINVTGDGYFPNDPAVADPAAGSIFAGTTNGPFTTVIMPGGTLNNASIELTDNEADDITVTAITAITAVPTGVTAPAIPGAPGHPVTLAWTGTADASNTPGDYTWEVTFEDAVNGTPVTVEVTITIGNLPPTHQIANASAGDGSSGTPYTTEYTVGMTSINDVDLASVTDPNVGQTPTISGITLGGGNPRVGAFMLDLIGGFLNIAPNGTVLTADIGTHTFDVEVTDGTNLINIHVSVTVSAAPDITQANPLPNGEQGQTYVGLTIAATGGTGGLTFAVVSGALPPGITLGANGLLSGLPSQQGAYAFTVTATDALGVADQQAFDLTIDPPATGTPTITTTTPLPNGVLNNAYGPVTLQVTGGAAPYAFNISSGNLPNGVTMSVAGVISGTPTTAQVANFDVTVTDAVFASSTTSFSITIQSPPPGSGGGGGGGGGGCVADQGNTSFWALLLGAMALLGVALRKRAVQD